MTIKIKIGSTLIPFQLILMYIFNTVILQYTINPVILQIGNFVPALLVFFITLYLFKDTLVSDWKKLSLSKWKLLLIAILGVIAIQLIFNVVNILFPVYENDLDRIAIPFSGLSFSEKVLFLIFSVGTVASGLTEEVYFRYLFIKKIFIKHQYFGLICSSFLFGVAHYFLEYTFVSTISYMVIGLFFGLIYLKTDNIWYTISIHMLNNLCFSILITFIS
ncbi:CPBP family intramembrane glutamic endopeptidase [Listeria costaricensis]|uniref:CPBP family intramembrane glutamic endopeptidase n=1 Tax=Listeria costaricensis TaxID=2026604 RepID=UPI0013C521FA|nr:type II CAAX endopeptidase family protein [Listeria costaricensis]